MSNDTHVALMAHFARALVYDAQVAFVKLFDGALVVVTAAKKTICAQIVMSGIFLLWRNSFERWSALCRQARIFVQRILITPLSLIPIHFPFSFLIR